MFNKAKYYQNLLRTAIYKHARLWLMQFFRLDFMFIDKPVYRLPTRYPQRVTCVTCVKGDGVARRGIDVEVNQRGTLDKRASPAHENEVFREVQCKDRHNRLFFSPFNERDLWSCHHSSDESLICQLHRRR